jgi:glycosyltransferase involved in cell wall biosynthesis
MRVLHVIPYFVPAFNYGGPPISTLSLCKALLRLGVNVEVFTTTANGASDLPASVEGPDVYEGVPVRYFPRAFPKRFYGAAGLAEAISKELDNYDLIHTHGLWNLPAWVSYRPARKAGVPYVISPEGMLDSGSMAYKPWRKRIAYLLTERRNLAGAAFLHATSTAEAQTLKSYGFDSNVVFLRKGVDFWKGTLPHRGSFRRKHSLDENAKLILFLGRIHPVKRLDILADAFGQVRGVIPNARLVIAGPDGYGHRKALEPLFTRVSDAVHWIGEVGQADKWALLRDVDVLVMCSDSESFGNSVIEAMAAGTPVVVTRTCPWQEIETAGCGFWIAQESREIARALIHILSHPAEARAMGERGQALARRNYDWDSIARELADHYAAAISARAVA